MQLDRTRIAIHERSFTDILDLALQVIREHVAAFTLLAVLGSAPMLVINCLWIHSWDLNSYVWDDTDLSTFSRNMFLLMGLCLLELPLATAPLTLYLGQSLFVSRPDRKLLVRNLLGSLPQLILLQVLLRALLMACVIPLVFVYVSWPYLSEIILLERYPLFKRREKPISTLSRMRRLHGPASGELFARWILSLIVGGLLMVIMNAGVGIVLSVLMPAVFDTNAGVAYTFQISFWIVMMYFTVVRYLSYLDLRIRSEGWEVELQLRAEGVRLARQFG